MGQFRFDGVTRQHELPHGFDGKMLRSVFMLGEFDWVVGESDDSNEQLTTEKMEPSRAIYGRWHIRCPDDGWLRWATWRKKVLGVQLDGTHRPGLGHWPGSQGSTDGPNLFPLQALSPEPKCSSCCLQNRAETDRR